MLASMALSGNSDTRLRPLPRKNLLKQFLLLAGDMTSSQQTGKHAARPHDVVAPTALCGEAHHSLVVEQLQPRDAADAAVLRGPVPRNTPPAIRDAGARYRCGAFRPSGCGDSMDMGARFQVKRISVKPEAALTLRKQVHGSEHRVIGSGPAEKTRNDKAYPAAENHSTFPRLRATHHLRDASKMPMEPIEMRSSSYLGEDDVAWLESRCGRP